jgi:very-short-patch-repair endonuclease
MPDKHDKSGRDRRVGALAARQHGVISADQLIRLGISRSTIGDRSTAGRLHSVHRGIYAVGHRKLSDEGRWMAAVLACGTGAVLSHTSAAELWGIRRTGRPSGSGDFNAVHVTVPIESGRRRSDDIMLHRSSTLTAGHCTRRDGIPVTTPARTLGDLRRILSPARFSAAVREAEFLRLPIGGRSETSQPRSELEQLFLSLCRHHRLPQPVVNARVDRYEVDFLWPAERLVVEVDGWESHRTRSAFEEDRRRDARLVVLGYEVLRFTWRQVERDARGVAKTIRALLRARC